MEKIVQPLLTDKASDVYRGSISMIDWLLTGLPAEVEAALVPAPDMRGKPAPWDYMDPRPED